MAFKPFSSGHDLTAADVNDLVGLYDRSTAAVDIVSSTTRTKLYEKVIAAGAMSTDRALWCYIEGDALNSAGAGNQGGTLEIAFGGSNIWADTNNSLYSSDADRTWWKLWFRISNRGATNVNRMSGEFALGTNTLTPPTTGMGPLSDNAFLRAGFSSNGDLAINTAVATTLTVWWTNSLNNASLSFRKKSAELWLA